MNAAYDPYAPDKVSVLRQFHQAPHAEVIYRAIVNNPQPHHRERLFKDVDYYECWGEIINRVYADDAIDIFRDIVASNYAKRGVANTLFILAHMPIKILSYRLDHNMPMPMSKEINVPKNADEASLKHLILGGYKLVSVDKGFRTRNEVIVRALLDNGIWLSCNKYMDFVAYLRHDDKIDDTRVMKVISSRGLISRGNFGDVTMMTVYPS